MRCCVVCSWLLKRNGLTGCGGVRRGRRREAESRAKCGRSCCLVGGRTETFKENKRVRERVASEKNDC